MANTNSQIYLNDMYKTPQITPVVYTLFPSRLGTFDKISTILRHKANLNSFYKTEIRMFSNTNQLNQKPLAKIKLQSYNVWKLSNKRLNNQN